VRLSYPKGTRTAAFILASWRAARMAVLARAEPPERVCRGEVDRANGGVECQVCGLRYRDHPESAMYSYLTVVCGGRFVKL